MGKLPPVSLGDLCPAGAGQNRPYSPRWWGGVRWAPAPGGRAMEARTVLGVGDPKPGRTPWQETEEAPLPLSSLGGALRE